MLSLICGGLLRLLPEVFGFLNKRTDNSHELAMIDRQVALEQAKAAGRVQEIQATGANESAAHASAETLAVLGAQAQALEGQMQKIGVWWADAMNILVRPVTTYYFLGCYGIVKTARIIIACQSPDALVALAQCWDSTDAETLAGILGFWFVGRSFEKRAK